MNQKIKLLLSTFLVSSCLFLGGITVKAEAGSAAYLVQQALQQKTFYHYNIAYYEVMQLTDGYEKAVLLKKLDSVSGVVWREDIKKIYTVLLDMVDTAGGRIYDNIQQIISNANIPEVDKQYLLGEVTSWGKRLVWTEDYKKSVDAIVNAWIRMDDLSINKAQAALEQMKNKYSKGYLSEELAKIKAKYNKTTVLNFNNNANINNYGFTASDGSWIYYSNFSNVGKLSKASKDGSTVLKINDDTALFINIYDGWIYYCNYSDNGSIYKVLADGSRRTKLTKDSAANIFVSDGWIYYQNTNDGSRLYKMNTDGTNIVKLTEDIPESVNVIGEYIYYTNFSSVGEIARINAEGKGKTTLNNEQSTNLNIYDGWIYYQGQDKSIYKMKIDGTGKTTVMRNPAVNFYPMGKWIYYINEQVNNAMYRVSTDGAANEKLTDFPTGGINILGDRIFFFDGEKGTTLYSMESDKSGFSWFGVGLKIAKVEAVNEEVAQGDYYEAPGFIKATMENGSNLDALVDFGIKLIDTKTIGTYSYKGRMAGYDEDVILNVKVVPKGNTDSNLINGGLLAEGNEWVYFADYKDRKLFKIKPDGSSKTALSGDRVNHINVIGEWVYYINESDGNKLYKIKSDGSGRKALSTDTVKDLRIIGNWVYYINSSDNDYLYKMKTDGTNKAKIISEKSYSFSIMGNWIFYSAGTEGQTIYRIKTDGTQKKFLSTGEYGSAGLIPYKNYLYFSQYPYLYRMNNDGTNRVQINSGSYLLNYNITEEGIYYNDHASFSLYFMSHEAKERKQLVTDNPYGIHVLGNYIYFTNNGDSNRWYKVRKDGSDKSKFGISTAISHVKNIDADVVLGSKFSLPSEVAAVTVDGEEIIVPVEWASDAINTLKTGRTLYTGRVKGTDIEVSLTLNVIDEKLIGNTTGNISNRSFAAQNEEWVFIYNYRMRPDGTQKTKYTEDIALNLNVIGDTIYYSNNGINKVNSNGTGKTRITADSASNVSVVGDWIYYINRSDNETLYKIRTNGQDREKLTNDIIREFVASEGWIYYRNNSDINKFYKIRTNGTQRVKISEDSPYYINVVGEWIYYQSTYNTLYKIKKDGSEKTLVTEVNEWCNLNISGDWMYLRKSDGLTKVSLDGTKSISICSVFPYNINVSGQWIYFESSDTVYRIKADRTVMETVVKIYE